MLYGATIPGGDSDPKKQPGIEDLEWGGALDNDNPDNFIHETEDRKRI